MTNTTVNRIIIFSCVFLLFGTSKVKSDEVYTVPYTWAEIMEKIPKTMPQKLSVYEDIFRKRFSRPLTVETYGEYTIKNVKTKDGYFINEVSGRGREYFIEIFDIYIYNIDNNCIGMENTLSVLGIEMNKNILPPNGPEPNNTFSYKKIFPWGLMAVEAYNKSRECVQSFVIRTED